MQEHKNKIEAILFTTGRFMDTEEIARLCHIGSIGLVKEALKDLIKSYDNGQGALRVFEENGKFKLNIRKQYNYLTSKLLTDSELDKPTQETLAIIAYKNPMLQSDLVKVRGNGAYEHVKILKEQELITSEKKGRTRVLKLASKFFDYFDVVPEDLNQNFEKVESKVLETSENGGEVDKERQEKLIENKRAKDKNGELKNKTLPEMEEKQLESREKTVRVGSLASEKIRSNDVSGGIQFNDE